MKRAAQDERYAELGRNWVQWFTIAVLAGCSGRVTTEEAPRATRPTPRDRSVDAGGALDFGPPAPEGSLEDSRRLGCSALCKATYAFPIDPVRHCVDQNQRTAITCTCDSFESSPGRCLQRLSDGSEWVFSDVTLEDESSWQPCPITDIESSFHSCDFANCAEPPQSTCNRADTCRQKQCDSVEYDADGCYRPKCSSDADCASSDRCVTYGCADTFACSYASNMMCGCGGPLPCITEDRCNSVAKYGPRGDWVAADFRRTTGHCAPGDDTCVTTWRITPDGLVAITRGGMPGGTTMLYDAVPSKELVDGPNLRAALRDGIDCNPPPPDVDVFMDLELTGQTLSRDITGCALNGPGDNVFEQVYAWVKNL